MQPTRGQPTKFTERVTTAILLNIADGDTNEIAASRAGISYQSLRNWLRQGQEDGENGNASAYFDFFEAVLRAQAERDHKRISMIERHAFDDWRASAWLLERTNPEQFGKQRADGAGVHLHQHQHNERVIVFQEMMRDGMITAEQVAALDAAILAKYAEQPRPLPLEPD